MQTREGGGRSPAHHITIEWRPVCMCQPGAHSQRLIPLFNNKFSAVYWPEDYIHYCISLLYVYEFINPSHELILSIVDKTHVITC
jgi:hypothetical protein